MCNISEYKLYRDINHGDMIDIKFLYRELMTNKKWQLKHKIKHKFKLFNQIMMNFIM